MALELEPVRFADLSWYQMQAAGQPVLLETDGVPHLTWIRLDGLGFRRWLRPGAGGKGVCFSDLTFRDPKADWSCPLKLQAGIVMTTPGADSAWLQPPFLPGEEELEMLHDLAHQELRRPEAGSHAGSTGVLAAMCSSSSSAYPPGPASTRAWLAREVAAMNRLSAEAVSPLAFGEED